MAGPTAPTVLIVDDEPALADGHAERLSDHSDVRTAYGGREALEALDPAVDVVLLDRRMPDLTGAEVIERIRRRRVDPQVVMLTGVEPAVDVVDMGFDEYLVKPVSRETLQETIERMRRRATYDEKLRQYFALASKRAALEARHAPDHLAGEHAYMRLRRRLTTLERELDEALAALPKMDGFLVATAHARPCSASSGDSRLEDPALDDGRLEDLALDDGRIEHRTSGPSAPRPGPGRPG